MSECFENTVAIGCYTPSGGVATEVLLHYTYDNFGAPAVRITNLAGVVITAANIANTTPGSCMTHSVHIETGCLSTPPAFDLTNTDKCKVTQVKIGTKTINISLAAGWNTASFVAAVNAVSPGLLAAEGNIVSITTTPPQSSSVVEIVCAVTDFLQDFGVGARTSSTNTNYTYAPSGPVPDGSYTVATFNTPGLAPWNTGQGNLVNDATGSPAGRVLIVNAAAPPGEVYRQPVTAVVGQEYAVEFFVVDTTEAGAPIRPNIKVEVQNAANVILAFTNTGPIPLDYKWKKFVFTFVATEANLQFVLRNNAPGGSGNDFAVDQISFSRVSRQLAPALPRYKAIPVEISKRVNNKTLAVETIRVYNVNGTIEYVAPYTDPDSLQPLILSVGQCPYFPQQTETPPVLPLRVTGGAAQIAGAQKTTTPAFSGAGGSFSFTGAPLVQSFTISALGVTDGLAGQTPNQVQVICPNGSVIALMNGETRTWSVTREQDLDLVLDYVVTATGLAYANITYTYIA